MFCHSVAVFGWQAGFYQPTRQAQENYLGDVCPGQSEAPSEKADFQLRQAAGRRLVLAPAGSAQYKAFGVVGSVKTLGVKGALDRNHLILIKISPWTSPGICNRLAEDSADSRFRQTKIANATHMV